MNQFHSAIPCDCKQEYHIIRYFGMCTSCLIVIVLLVSHHCNAVIGYLISCEYLKY